MNKSVSNSAARLVPTCVLCSPSLILFPLCTLNTFSFMFSLQEMTQRQHCAKVNNIIAHPQKPHVKRVRSRTVMMKNQYRSFSLCATSSGITVESQKLLSVLTKMQRNKKLLSTSLWNSQFQPCLQLQLQNISRLKFSINFSHIAVLLPFSSMGFKGKTVMVLFCIYTTSHPSGHTSHLMIFLFRTEGIKTMNKHWNSELNNTCFIL